MAVQFVAVAVYIQVTTYVHMCSTLQVITITIWPTGNEVRVDGGTEWQATGNGAQSVPTRCQIHGLMNISHCKLML